MERKLHITKAKSGKVREFKQTSISSISLLNDGKEAENIKKTKRQK
jgi:hypothetical protein